MFVPWPTEPTASGPMDLFDHRVDLRDGGMPDATSFPARGGVYLIVDAAGRPVFLSYGENLRRLISHRLSPPASEERTKRANLAPVAAAVLWRETFSRFETALTHWHLARTLDPKGYREHIGFSPCWFLRASPQGPAPRLTTVKTIRDEEAAHVGPFAARREAEAWRRMLEDLFDLCRYPHVLDQAPNGEPCAYHEMGKCDAPCDGSVEMAVYRARVAGAVAFSSGDHAPRLQGLRAVMKDAAGRLAFEKAETIRKTLDRAETFLKKREYEHLGDLSACQWLIVQRASPRRRSAKTAWVKPFLIRQGRVEVGTPVEPAAIGEAMHGWLAACEGAAPPWTPNLHEGARRSEVLWLVAKFLFQRERAPGLFLRFDQLPDEAALSRRITETFSSAREEGDPTNEDAEANAGDESAGGEADAHAGEPLLDDPGSPQEPR